MRPYRGRSNETTFKSAAEVTTSFIVRERNVRYIFHVEHIVDDETENVK